MYVDNIGCVGVIIYGYSVYEYFIVVIVCFSNIYPYGPVFYYFG